MIRAPTPVLVVLALAALVLAGCGSSADRAQRMTLAALDLPGPRTPAAAPSPPG